jgi:hypothetical protein
MRPNRADKALPHNTDSREPWLRPGRGKPWSLATGPGRLVLLERQQENKMSDIAPSESSKGKPTWEAVTDGVDRLPVPGGWIYRTDRGVVFVPDRAQDISHMDTGAVG